MGTLLEDENSSLKLVITTEFKVKSMDALLMKSTDIRTSLIVTKKQVILGMKKIGMNILDMSSNVFLFIFPKDYLWVERVITTFVPSWLRK